ncbi:MAG: PEP-CTERM sorting domain-containing protein [Planctomycetes bacterium]|nr:PEP-CTERM sorting domain-containing protein [Planctomycetota bacterium]
MRKVLVLLMVLSIASVASATVIDVVTDGIGSLGAAGTAIDELARTGETIQVKFVLNNVPGSFPGPYPSYDGYVLSAMDLVLNASNATIDAAVLAKGNPKWGEHADWTFKGTPSGMGTGSLSTGAYASNAATLGTTFGIDAASGTNVDVLWDILITPDGSGLDIVLSWGLATVPGQYYDYVGDGVVADPTANNITLGSLGGSTIYVVPEPMTMALLGLGGLFLRRRKK